MVALSQVNMNNTIRNSARSIQRTSCLSRLQSDNHATGNKHHKLLSSLLSGFLAPYWEVTPTAGFAVTQIDHWLPNASIAFDHFAFRTFGIKHLGISSVAEWFTDLGYQERDSLDFPAKRLRARWYAPPVSDLPRIFISELKVEELSSEAQRIISHYSGIEDEPKLYLKPEALRRRIAVTGLLGCTPWGQVTKADYQKLAAESEYAVWVLVNGYALNHATISVHRLEGLEGGIDEVNAHLLGQGLELNAVGGITKVSPDGLLLQSSTVADSVQYTFEDGSSELVPGAYIEFAERLVLKEFSHLRPDAVEERHRREGFEAGNADKIFESTTVAARRLAVQEEN